MMKMWFHGGTQETVLFDFWKITDGGSMAYSFVIIFLLAFLYEGLKYFRDALYSRHFRKSTRHFASDTSTAELDKKSHQQSCTSSMLSGIHILQTVLHTLQFFVSYLLMLIVMTYNSWLCLAVVLGAALGFFLFGWQRQNAVDVTEHCQ